MELRPQDLGNSLFSTLMNVRAVTQRTGTQANSAPTNSPNAIKSAPAAFRKLERFWLRKSGVSEEQAEIAARAARGVTFGMAIGLPLSGAGFALPMFLLAGSNLSISLLFGAIWAGLGAVGFFVPASILKRMVEASVSEAEIDVLLDAARDPLEKDLLSLIREMVRRDVLPESLAETVRAATGHLAEAIHSLPPAAPQSAERAPEALLADAETIHAKGLSEADPVVSESLLRRADAMRRSAEAIGRSQQALRRGAALRDELTAQIEALRFGLASYAADETRAGELAALADSARSIARHATANATARAELERFTAAPEPEPVLRAGNRG